MCPAPVTTVILIQMMMTRACQTACSAIPHNAHIKLQKGMSGQKGIQKWDGVQVSVGDGGRMG